MDIYANAVPLNMHDVRTQHTGGDCVKIRRYRAGLVCLLLLCVLLLTGVIFLCVHIHTKNTNHTEEKDQLLTKITNLTEARDQLVKKNTQLTEERDGLSSSKCDRINLFSDEWISYQCSLYFISSLRKNWTESRKYCTERGADLIIINNREENDFVKKISRNAFVWIGLTDSEVERTWKWVDGSTLNPSSSFWDPREPNGGTGENCALNYSPGWADYSCTVLSQWICEIGRLK